MYPLLLQREYPDYKLGKLVLTKWYSYISKYSWSLVLLLYNFLQVFFCFIARESGTKRFGFSFFNPLEIRIWILLFYKKSILPATRIYVFSKKTHSVF